MHTFLDMGNVPVQALDEGEVAGIDPEQAKARALEEEEARAAAKRSLGTAVTPDTFAAWKQRFLAETALAQVQSQNQTTPVTTGGQQTVQTFKDTVLGKHGPRPSHPLPQIGHSYRVCQLCNL